MVMCQWVRGFLDCRLMRASGQGGIRRRRLLGCVSRCTTRRHTVNAQRQRYCVRGKVREKSCCPVSNQVGKGTVNTKVVVHLGHVLGCRGLSTKCGSGMSFKELIGRQCGRVSEITCSAWVRYDNTTQLMRRLMHDQR